MKWSDGKPFTAKDVAFTLNLGKKYPGIDRAGLWTDTFGAAATSVTAEGNQVKIAFGGNAAPKFDELIKLQILPEHVYSTVGDASKYIDKTPVATGPVQGRQLQRPPPRPATPGRLLAGRQGQRCSSSCWRASSTPRRRR